jgi:hypothetical protein
LNVGTGTAPLPGYLDKKIKKDDGTFGSIKGATFFPSPPFL